MDDMNAFIVHGDAHVQQAKAKKLDKNMIKQAESTYAAFDKLLTTLMKAKQQAQEEAMKVVADQHAIQANQFAQEAAGGMTSPDVAQQMAAPDQGSDMSPAAPAGQGSEMNEKTLIAWISQYPNLPDEAKQNLMNVGGIGPVQDPTVTPIPKAKPQEQQTEDIGMPPLPDPTPSVMPSPPPAPEGAPESQDQAPDTIGPMPPMPENVTP